MQWKHKNQQKSFY